MLLKLLEAHVLFKVNRWRKELGEEPLTQLPVGQLGSARHCVIAASSAFIYSVERDKRMIRDKGYFTCHPAFNDALLRLFIALFDKEYYPHLTLNPHGTYGSKRLKHMNAIALMATEGSRREHWLREEQAKDKEALRQEFMGRVTYDESYKEAPQVQEKAIERVVYV